MHLLVIGINYAPEQTSVAPFTTGLCEHLVERGHQVSVITAFPYYPQWRIHDGYRDSLYRRENINGVEVRRVIHYVPSRPRDLVQRLLHDISFSFNAMLAIPTVGSFDGIFCSNPPPFVPTVAWLASRQRGVPFAIKLTDLASSAAKALNMINETSYLARLARVLENFNYRQAEGISVLCEGFKDDLIGYGVAPDKISVVPDWADVQDVRPLPRDNAFRHQNGLATGEFLALHTGNMGLKQGLQTVVESAKLSSSRITWMLVGDGEERRKLEALSQNYSLTNLHFLLLQPKELFPFVLASADVLLLVQKATVTDSVIPSKLLTYMAAGRPIVASVHLDSEAARRIREAGCGLIVPPESPHSLSEAVEWLRATPVEAERLGINGRAYVEKYFAKDAVLEMYDQFLAKTFPGFSSL